MATIVQREEFILPQARGVLDAEAFWGYLDGELGSKKITSRVKGRFEPVLFAKTGYGDEQRPAAAVESEVQVGDYVFAVTTKPTTKTPAYKQVVEGLGDYVGFLREQRAEEEVLRRGMRRLDGELYVHLDVLEEKLERDLRETLQGKEGVEQSTKGLLYGEGLVEPEASRAPASLALGIGTDYGRLTERNAAVYWDALNYLLAVGERSRAFKDALKEESLRVLGSEPTEPVSVCYAFDGMAFYHQLEPRARVAYRGVIDAFLKPAPAALRKNSAVGDFPLVRRFVEGDQAVREKGLVDQDFLADYHPRVDGGRVFIRLDGVRDRLDQYTEGTPFLEQNITVRRVSALRAPAPAAS